MAGNLVTLEITEQPLNKLRWPVRLPTYKKNTVRYLTLLENHLFFNGTVQSHAKIYYVSNIAQDTL